MRGVVLDPTHEKVFSSGGNLAGFAADVPLVHKHAAIARFPRLFELIGTLGKPTLCAASGHVLAGALGLALACDLVVAKRGRDVRHARDQRRRLPVHDHGADLPQRRRARRPASCCCSASASTRDEAERLGIVNRVVPADEFDAAVADWAARLAASRRC